MTILQQKKTTLKLETNTEVKILNPPFLFIFMLKNGNNYIHEATLYILLKGILSKEFITKLHQSK